MAMPAARIETAHEMFAQADLLRDLKAAKKELEDKLKEVNKQIESIEEALVQNMINEEMQSFVRAGHTFYLSTRLFASAVPERKQELFAWLKEHGYGDLVYETVNANSLSAWVRELKEETDELPEELAELINVHEKITVNMRKAN